MIADLVLLWDTTGDKLYVNVWALTAVLVLAAVLVWARVWGPNRGPRR